MKLTNKSDADAKLRAEAVKWLTFPDPEMAGFTRIVAFIVNVFWRFSIDKKYFSAWIRESKVQASSRGVPLPYYLSLVAVSLLTPSPKRIRAVTRSRKSGGKHGKR